MALFVLRTGDEAPSARSHAHFKCFLPTNLAEEPKKKGFGFFLFLASTTNGLSGTSLDRNS
jgi:hypothetical protein